VSRLANFRGGRGRRRRVPSSPDGSMSLMEHLRELRNRLFKCALAIFVCAFVLYFFYGHIYKFATAPYCDAIKGTNQKSCQLVFLDLVSPFATKLRVTTYLGVLVALPVIFYQLWRFIAPGLYRTEKRYALSFVISSVLLFAMGAVLAYVSLPKIFQWLLNQGGEAVIQAKAEDYFSLLALMIVVFGLSFEFPLLLLVLQLIGVVKPDTLAHYRRHAIVGIVTVVAIVLPGGDPISLFALSIPLCLFYEASIWIARLLLRRRTKAPATNAAA
jgi:sec-independent protein translocase protein TatC